MPKNDGYEAQVVGDCGLGIDGKRYWNLMVHYPLGPKIAWAVCSDLIGLPDRAPHMIIGLYVRFYPPGQTRQKRG